MLDIVMILKEAQLAIKSMYSSLAYFEIIDFAKFIDVFVKYIDNLVNDNMEQYANDKLLMTKAILLQDEKDKKLKVTRAMTHLEDAYVILARQKGKKLSKKKKEKVQHTIDLICCGLAVLHKLMGNSPEVVRKYIIELTSLNNPDKDYLGFERFTEKTEKYIILSSKDLKFLLTKQQYKEYMSFYGSKRPYSHTIMEEQKALVAYRGGDPYDYF